MEFFETLNNRRSVRKFKETPVSDEIIKRALEAAILAPNSSNTQTWDFHWIKGGPLKPKVIEACLSQSAAKTAAHLVVITTNSKNWKRSQPRLIEWVTNAKTHPSVVSYYKKLVPIMYTAGPLSVFAPLKWLLSILTGITRPMMRGPFTQRAIDVVGIKSAALACENFVLAISAQGADTCMMEGFDDWRLRRTLQLSCSTQIVMVIAVGYRDERGLWGPRYRIPLDEVMHVYE